MGLTSLRGVPSCPSTFPPRTMATQRWPSPHEPHGLGAFDSRECLVWPHSRNIWGNRVCVRYSNILTSDQPHPPHMNELSRRLRQLRISSGMTPVRSGQVGGAVTLRGDTGDGVAAHRQPELEPGGTAILDGSWAGASAVRARAALARMLQGRPEPSSRGPRQCLRGPVSHAYQGRGTLPALHWPGHHGLHPRGRAGGFLRPGRGSQGFRRFRHRS